LSSKKIAKAAEFDPLL